MANNKSPGPDGIPIELYKMFWRRLGPVVLRALNSLLEKTHRNSVHDLPIVSTGAITLLFKKGDRDLMKNYRPITLLSSLYKILSKTLANRLGAAMGIDSYQRRPIWLYVETSNR